MGRGRRARLYVFPRWDLNPYLTMLCLAAEADGWDIDGGLGLTDLAAAIEDDLRPGDVVHVHWTAPVTRGVASVEEAMERAARFDRLLAVARARDLHVLWTVHNEVAHETPSVAADLAMNASLARRATRVIQLHEHTASALAPETVLPPERTVTLPHASYAGLYPMPPSAREARTRVGCPEDVPTVGLIGLLRPYKGVDLLLEAAALAAREVQGLTVLLAGRAAPEEQDRIENLIPAGLEVIRHYDFIPDDEIGAWFQACNVLALPFRRILNSGSVLLAATFGRPVILPDATALAGLYGGQGWVDLYSTAKDPCAALAEVIVRRARRDGAREAAARAFAAGYTPYDMSRAYLRLLDGLAPTR